MTACVSRPQPAYQRSRLNLRPCHEESCACTCKRRVAELSQAQTTTSACRKRKESLGQTKYRGRATLHRWRWTQIESSNLLARALTDDASSPRSGIVSSPTGACNSWRECTPNSCLIKSGLVSEPINITICKPFSARYMPSGLIESDERRNKVGSFTRLQPQSMFTVRAISVY